MKTLVEDSTASPDRVIQFPVLPSSTNPSSFYSANSDTQLHVCENVIECVSNAPCPCCNRPLGSSFDERLTLNEPPKSENRLKLPDRTQPSLLKSDEDDNDEDGEFDNDLLPGTLSCGVEYKPTLILAEGWLHKKGTGKDWLGSTSWKARYVKLVCAKVGGFEVDIPLLLIYWFQYSEAPSTVISLDSTVVIPIDKDDPTLRYAFQWNVVHARDEQQCTRTFAAPRKGRDTWVWKMNEALMAYEKNKSIEKKRHNQLLLFQKRPTSPELVSDDRFVRSSRTTFSPPSSPRPLEKRPLPRPQRLKGESLLR